MNREHLYNTELVWTGNRGEGTSAYRTYDRDHIISIPGKPDIPGSSDPSFRGDRSRYNPEEMLVSSLSACHMLWYLHVCSDGVIIVTAYSDAATGTMQETAEGGQFTGVTLHPRVTVLKQEMISQAYTLHEKAHALCYIARSVTFPVHHEPVCASEEKE